VLSETQDAELAKAFHLIADRAPTLRDRELRTLVALSKLFIGTDNRFIGRGVFLGAGRICTLRNVEQVK
jgi:hypothetical protein